MLSYMLEHACQWCVALCKDANEVAVGFDEGVVAVKVYILFENHSPKLMIPI